MWEKRKEKRKKEKKENRRNITGEPRTKLRMKLRIPNKKSKLFIEY